MRTYKSEYKRGTIYFRPDLQAAPPRARSRLHGKIHGLMLDPRPSWGEVLAGHTNRWRIRVGAYRMVYAIDDQKKAVTIIGVGYRQGRAIR